MKTYINMTLFHIKRILKNPKLLISIVAPILMVFMMVAIFNSEENVSMGDFAIVSHSEYFDKEVYPKLEKEYRMPIETNIEELKEKLNKNKISVIYEFPSTFKDDMSVSAYSVNGKIENQYFEENLKEILFMINKNKVLEAYQLNNKVIEAPEVKFETQKELLSSTLLLTLFFTFYFMYLNSSMFSVDLLEMKNTQVLRRSIISKSPTWTILGSVLSAYGIILLVINLIIIGLMSISLDIDLTNMNLIVGYLLANIIYVMGFVMLMFRIFKSEQVMQGVTLAIGMSFVLLPQFTNNTSFEKIGMLSPFYWTMEGLDYSTLFPQCIIIIVMGILLFTAGSLKIEELSNNKN